MTRRDTLVIPCAHAECPNTMTIGADELEPAKDWICSTCERSVDEQFRSVWAEEYLKRYNPNSNPTKPQRTH